MTFKEYWQGLTEEARLKLADDCESSVDYLYLIAMGHKPAGHKTAWKIEEKTEGRVTRFALRPDIFGPPPAKLAKRTRAANSPQSKAAA